MATAAHRIQLFYLRSSRQAAVLQRTLPAVRFTTRRSFATTPAQRDDGDSELSRPALPTAVKPGKRRWKNKERKQFEAQVTEIMREKGWVDFEPDPADIKLDPKITRFSGGLESRPNQESFWYDEDDEDTVTENVGDEFNEDDLTEMGHAKLDEIRDMRQWTRVMAWEMPLLSKLAKPFEAPTNEQVLRFRYTTYMGEFHPAESKVVVQFCPADLNLTPVQESKLKKLAGTRYNPETETVKISCESFDHQAQNKRYLLSVVDKLIAAAKDPTDTFEDIPLDTRHHKSKVKPKFPVEWRLTEERKKELEIIREQALLRDGQGEAEGTLVDGAAKIEGLLASTASPQTREMVAELLAAPVRLKPRRGVTKR